MSWLPLLVVYVAFVVVGRLLQKLLQRFAIGRFIIDWIPAFVIGQMMLFYLVYQWLAACFPNGCR